MKNLAYGVLIILVGALLGSFIGKLMGIWFPTGNIHDLFAVSKSAGLSPITVDLMVVKLTFGCMFDLNITGVLGMVGAALIIKTFFK